MEPYGSLFSDRVLIASHSIPLLKDTVLIGDGSGMYATVFPNDDLTLRMNGMGQNTIVDKPHNMYLQIGTDAGMVGLLALFSSRSLHLPKPQALYSWTLQHLLTVPRCGPPKQHHRLPYHRLLQRPAHVGRTAFLHHARSWHRCQCGCRGVR